MIKPSLTLCEILENIEVNPGYFKIKIRSSPAVEGFIPGQFFDVKTADRLDIILRRPLSIYDYDAGSISFLYEVAGKGTKILSEKKPGEILDILGPLGNGFSIQQDIKTAILAGGGIGIAPLHTLAKELVKIKGIEVKVLIGAKNREKVLCENDFKNMGIIPNIATDDGSYGRKGLVTDLLVTCNLRLEAFLYACGPNMMLKETANIIKKYNLTGQLSLDKQMCCGVGACLGCVVETTDGKYKRVCKDGPVFNSNEIKW